MHDLIIVGGGPSGLAAAINAASEGLSVCLLDRDGLGGQAKQSAAIENYPGFPTAITGHDLMGRLIAQAWKFGVDMQSPLEAFDLASDGPNQGVMTTDGEVHLARAVLISSGMTYRRLLARDAARYLGRGLFYGMPDHFPSGCHVAIIGGANSAGQAAVKLASRGNVHVHMLVRSSLEKGMSTYLIDRIRALPNVTVHEGVEVAAFEGNTTGLTGLTLKSGGSIAARHAYVFIGGIPNTAWARRALHCDDKGYVYTWHDAGVEVPFQTCKAGIFAAGDCRANSVKRIATAAGEGIWALQMIHRYLGGGL